MAIKGKGKTKSRQVARAPRASYVAPTPPFMARRWVQVTAAFVVGILAILFVAWVRAGLRNQSDDRESLQQQRAEQTVIREYKGEIDPILARVGTATAPVAFEAFPELAGAITASESGASADEASQETATTTGKAAADAADRMDRVDAAGIVRDRGVSRPFATALIDATSKLRSGLRIYAESALALERATRAKGAEREQLLASARELQTVAAELFQAGYQDYVEAQASAGVLQPPAGGGLPIGT